MAQVSTESFSTKDQVRKSVSLDDAAPIFVSLEEMVTLMKNEHPDGVLKYKFLVDCSDDEDWVEVQRQMNAEGFVVGSEKTHHGNHYGLKEFDTPVQAESAMKSLFDRFTKFNKIKNITLKPVIING